MFTLVNGFAFLAATITLILASFLIRKQDEHQEEILAISLRNQSCLEEIANDVEIMTGENETEYTLTYLEKRMNTLNLALQNVKAPSYKRRDKHVRFKKNRTND